MERIVNLADSLKESPASSSFVSHRTGTGNNENPIAKQESKEVRQKSERIELAGNGQITRSQPIRIRRDAPGIFRQTPIEPAKAGARKATSLPLEPNLSRLACPVGPRSTPLPCSACLRHPADFLSKPLKLYGSRNDEYKKAACPGTGCWEDRMTADY
jgi:hypothetical protein